MKTQQQGKLYPTDRIVIDVYERLVSDLCASISFTGSMKDRLHSGIRSFKKTGDATDLRGEIARIAVPWGSSPYIFKATIQLRDFLKRYKFETDLYSKTDLQTMTVAKFLEVQEYLAQPHEVKESTQKVVRRARQIISAALGPYDPEEHLVSCRFSSKACVGFPTPRSYLFNKFDGPITGSYGHLEWFKQTVLAGSTSPVQNFLEVDTLKYHTVPKSYKILRGITPNTLVGSYHSYGLGKMLERRLKTIGIDVSRQPDLHKRLAKRASITRHLVTADLSSASDSFTSELVEALVPPDWFEQLNLGRIEKIDIGGTVYPLRSFMAMGIGFTFPLQTLLFYALIKATQELLGSDGFISVFGDDLIYPRRIHRFVVGVLSDLKFRLNEDKTFSEMFFRESCGGDFYHGIDVRPASPEQDSARLGKWHYLAFLHKLINSLTLRFHPDEIPGTIYLLKKELMSVQPLLMIIPDDLPDYSGVKRIDVDGYHFLDEKPRWDHGYQSRTFVCLCEKPKDKLVPTLIGYYWEQLNTMAADSFLHPVDPEAPYRSTSHIRTHHDIPRDLYGSAREVLVRVSDRRRLKALGIKQPKNYRSRITHQRIRLEGLVTADKQGRSTFVVHQALSILAS